MIESGLVGSRAENAQGTPTQSHISPSILAFEDKSLSLHKSPRLLEKPSAALRKHCEDWVLDGALVPNTVELIPTLGAISPRGGPVQDPVLTSTVDRLEDFCLKAKARIWP